MPASFSSLETALRRCVSQDATGLELVYQQESPRMLALAEHVLEDQTAAQKALHDCMVLVWQHASQFNPAFGTARGWIFSILRYRLQALQRQLNPTPNSDTSPYWSWLEQHTPCLTNFPQAYRTVLDEEAAQYMMLAYCKGLSARKVDDIFSLAPTSAFNLMTQALGKMAALEPERPGSNDGVVIAQYVLGILNVEQTGTVQAQIASDDNALQFTLYWENLFSHLTQALAVTQPNETVWLKVQDTLNLTLIPQPLKAPEAASSFSTPRPEHHKPKRKKLKTGVFTTLFAVIIIACGYIWLAPIKPTLQTHENNESAASRPPAPLSLHVALLQAPGSTSTPAWLVVSREPDTLNLTPYIKTRLNDNQQLVLWRRQLNSPTLQKLGRIRDTGTSKIHLDSTFSVVEPMLYEITIEPVSQNSAEPAGDIVFIGQSVRLTVPDPEPEAPPVPDK